MPRLLTPMIDRLMSKVQEDSKGCWIFYGTKNFYGYGVIGAGGRTDGLRMTHRVTYEFFITEIPKELHLDHLCRIRECCNPWHLEPVTQAINNLRASRDNPRTHCKHGHEYLAGSYYQKAKQRVCKACHKNWSKPLQLMGETNGK